MNEYSTEYCSYEIYNFTLTVSLTAAMVSAVRDGMTVAIELVLRNFCRKSSNVECLFC